jgi:hypothetical protein
VGEVDAAEEEREREAAAKKGEGAVLGVRITATDPVPSAVRCGSALPRCCGASRRERSSGDDQWGRASEERGAPGCGGAAHGQRQGGRTGEGKNRGGEGNRALGGRGRGGADGWARSGSEREKEGSAGLRGKRAGVVAHAGEERKGRVLGLGFGPRGKRGECVGLGWLLLLFPFFCSSYSLIQTILFEFKSNLNSKLYTQHK